MHSCKCSVAPHKWANCSTVIVGMTAVIKSANYKKKKNYTTEQGKKVPQLFSSPHEIVTDSHTPASNCLALFLNALTWSWTLPSPRDGIFLYISCLWRFRVCQLPCWYDVLINLHVHFVQESCCLADVTQPLFFTGLVHTSLAGTEKVSWHFPPSKWAPQTWVFGASGVFFRRTFTIHSLRCYSSAGSRWKDSSPLTVLALLHPPLPSTPQRRCLKNCTSSLGKIPHLQFFSSLCLLARNKRHVRASCQEEKSNSKRNLLVEQQNLGQQPSFKLLLPISVEKYPAATVVKHSVTSHSLFCIRARVQKS